MQRRAPHCGLWGALARDGTRVAVATSFKITMVEGIEVVFIVIAMGGIRRGLLLPASLGALAALILVIMLGAALHKPVAMIPENMLKFMVGVLLCSFGTFWVGEGMGILRGPVRIRRACRTHCWVSWPWLSQWRGSAGNALAPGETPFTGQRRRA